MPTYEYECKQCGRMFELFQSMTARPVRTIECECTDCNNRAPVVRLIGTGSGVLFKGEGFYQTDYRSESYKRAVKAETGGGESESRVKSDKKEAGTQSDKSASADGTSGASKTKDMGS